MATPTIDLELGAQFAAFLDAIPDPLLVVSQEGRIVRVNRQATELFGYAEPDLNGSSIERLIPERLRAAHATDRSRYQASPRVRPMGSGYDLVARHRDGNEFPVEVSLSPLRLSSGEFVICTVRDIRERMRLHQQLRFLSTHDVLTNLYNRRFFDEELARFERGRHFPISLITLDVDGLKATNDRLGHAAGDEMLRRTASVLRTALRADEIIARLGGDEFAVLLPDTGPEALADLVTRLRATTVQHNQAAIGPPLVSFSLGCATARNEQSLGGLLREADAAMYEEKRSRQVQRRPAES